MVDEGDLDRCIDCGCEIGPDNSEDALHCDDCSSESDDEFDNEFDRW